MNKGKIKAYSKNKKYGFITDEKNQDLFFHFDNLSNKNEEEYLVVDSIVEYEETVTKKGLRALKVKLIKSKNKSNQQKKYNVEFFPRFFINKMPEPKRGKVLLKVEFETAGYRSKDKAKSALINTAKKLGYNAVLGYYHERHQKRCDNYIYNLNYYTGYFCLVLENKQSNKASDINLNDIDLEKLKKETKQEQLIEYGNGEEITSKPTNTSKQSQRPEWGDFQFIKTTIDFFK